MTKLPTLLFPLTLLALACGPDDGGVVADEAGSSEGDQGSGSGSVDPGTGTGTGSVDDSGSGSGGEEVADVPARGIRVSLVEANPGVAVPIGRDGAWVGPEGRNAPLPKGRNTVVRVYVDVDEAAWVQRDIEARLSIHLPDGTVQTQSEVTTVATDSSTASLQSGYMFGVLAEHMVPGVKYQVQLFEAADTGWESLPEATEPPSTPAAPEIIGVEATELSMKIVLVPVDYSGPGCSEAVTADDETLQRYADAMYQQNPIETLDIRWDAPYVVDDLDLTNGNDFFTLLGRAQQYRASQAPDPNTYYYMLFDNCGECIAEGGGCLLGVAGGIPDDSVGAAPMRAAIGTQFLSGSEVGMDTFVHEIGHTQGRQHVACPGAAAGGPDPTYPYAGGEIGVWGFGVRDFQVRTASTHTDYMSYCSPTWVSDWQWNATYDRIRTLTSWDSASVSTPADQAVLVGSVDPASGRAQWWTERGDVAVASEGHSLRFMAGGAVLETSAARIDAWSEGAGFTVRAPLPASWDGDEITAIEYVGPEQAFVAPRADVASYHRPDSLATP